MQVHTALGTLKIDVLGSEKMTADLTRLARQGDPRAIADLLNRSLQPKGVTAKTTLSDSCLKILLEATPAPDRVAALRFARDGLRRLAPEKIETVKLYGKHPDGVRPAWEDGFELKQAAEKAESPVSSVATTSKLKPVIVVPGKQPEKQARIVYGLKLAGLLVVAGWVGLTIYSRFQPSPEVQETRSAIDLINRSLVELDRLETQSAERLSTPGSGITLSKYNQVQTGMTLAQVESVLGRSGQEMSRVEVPGVSTTVVYMWQNPGGSNMNATFQGGSLTLKAQFALE